MLKLQAAITVAVGRGAKTAAGSKNLSMRLYLERAKVKAACRWLQAELLYGSSWSRRSVSSNSEPQSPKARSIACRWPQAW